MVPKLNLDRVKVAFAKLSLIDILKVQKRSIPILYVKTISFTFFSLQESKEIPQAAKNLKIPKPRVQAQANYRKKKEEYLSLEQQKEKEKLSKFSQSILFILIFLIVGRKEAVFFLT